MMGILEMIGGFVRYIFSLGFNKNKKNVSLNSFLNGRTGYINGVVGGAVFGGILLLLYYIFK